MNPEPTIINSVDYLVELSDDGKQSDQPETEVIILRPTPHGTDGSPGTTSAPEQPSLSRFRARPQAEAMAALATIGYKHR